MCDPPFSMTFSGGHCGFLFFLAWGLLFTLAFRLNPLFGGLELALDSLFLLYSLVVFNCGASLSWPLVL
jgi:hypothetical protein